MSTLKPIEYYKEENMIQIIDQTKLPNNLVYKQLYTLEDVWLAIKSLEVRGAPLIGLTASIGIAMYAQTLSEKETTNFKHSLFCAIEYLMSARPTAVNLFYALNRQKDILNTPEKNILSLKEAIFQEAQRQIKEDACICKSIGDYGQSLLKSSSKVLTYCNAGSLATGNSYGTALAPIYRADELNKNIHVFACETRPVLQGARLTAFELTYNKIDTTVITDNMIGWLLMTQNIDAVFVGCDRVAKNGDFANKIGTHTLAVLAKNYHIPFYVCAPSTTFDFNAKDFRDITIEFREDEEVRSLWYKEPMIAADAKILNPAFDCTPAEYITGYITEKGIMRPPFNEVIFNV